MDYRQLGNSDLQIPRLALGCMSLPTNEKDAADIMHHALHHGINYFDTADIYNDGLNETLIGKALKQHRSRVLIGSKVGNVRRKDGGLDWNPTKEHILASIEGTLTRLDTDYVDLYQLHGGTIQDDFEEVIETFQRLQAEGKIRYFGISSIRPNVISRFLEASAIVSDMIQYSLLDRRPEEQCLEWLQKKHVGVLTRGSLAQGLLVNKPAKAYLEHTEAQVRQAAMAVRSLATETRLPSHVALRYVLQHPAVTSAVVGTRTRTQLDEMLRLFDTEPLSHEEMEILRNSIPAILYREHRV